ncbi:unnamed protein product, partial [Lota lota]
MSSKSTDVRECPMCGKHRSHISNHLTNVEKVRNVEEKALLLRWASGRISGRLNCQICEKRCLARLDKHLVELHRLDQHEVTYYMFLAKQALTVERLGELRATNPIIPMVSTLDLKHQSREKEEAAAGHDKEPGPSSATPAVVSATPQRQSSSLPLLSPHSTPKSSSCPPSPWSMSCSKDSPNHMPSPSSAATCPSSGEFPKLVLATSPSNSTPRLPISSSPLQPYCDMPVSCRSSTILLTNQMGQLTKRMEGMETVMKQMQETMLHMQQYTAAQTASSSAAYFASPSPGKKHQHMQRRPQLKRTVVGNALLQFQRASLGYRMAKKDMEKARSRRCHAQRFCAYMSKGEVPKRGMRALYNVDKLRAWPTVLKKSHYRVTTIKKILSNVRAFLMHLDLFHRGSSEITAVQIGQLQQTIKGLQSDIMKDVLTHRQAIQRTKSEHMLSPAQQNSFPQKAKRIIPKLLRRLEERATPSDLDLVYGYVTGYLAIVSGHRPVVFTSLRIQEVLGAENQGEKFILWVGEHKTQKSFGLLALYEEEYGWLKALTRIVNGLHGDSPFLLVRRDGKPITKLNKLLMNAWRDAGMEGMINFNMVRSSVSTQVKKHLSAEEQTRVVTSMCHDVATADRFNCPAPDVTDAFQVRQLRVRALVDGGETREEDTTEEEEEPKYDDSPDTSSPPTPRPPP